MSAAGTGRARCLRAGRRCCLLALLLAGAVAAGGCASLVASAASGFASNLSSAILDQDDPELVREATPAYLLLLDSFARDSRDPAMLGAAAQLYAAYGTLFVSDPQRAAALTRDAREYGRRALCAAAAAACDIDALVFDEYAATLDRLGSGAADALYSYCVGSLAYIQAHSDDFVALADLPKVERALERLADFASGERLGDVYKYLGILNSLRPPALGGRPERGRDFFERALAINGDRDLSIRVEYARGYARLVYDRELHDRLLNEVLAADVEQPGFTLFNSLAREQARRLLAEADEYF